MNQTPSDHFRFRQYFPCLWLFRTFRIALDFRKMLLGVVALIVIVQGNEWIDKIGLSEESTDRRPLDFSLTIAPPSADLAPTSETDNAPTGSGWTSLIAPTDHPLLRPWLESAVRPATRLLRVETTFAARVDALCRILLFLLVGAVFGVAITRMAVFEFVRDERLGLRTALGFSCRRLHHALTAPLLPIGGCAAILALCAVGGLFARIPVAGPWIVSLTWFIPLILSIGIAIMLIGVSAGWPLMVAALSTEDSDGFDAFSRAHSYVYDRPWHYLGYIAILLVYGLLASAFVTLVAGLVWNLAELGIGIGAGNGAMETLLDGTTTPAAVLAFWHDALGALALGFRVSFLWTGVALTYLLLRRAVDNTPMKEAFLEPVTQPADGSDVAISGMAAVRDTVPERPVVNPDPPAAVNPGEIDVSER